MSPLIIKRYDEQNTIAQMYQAESNADEEIANDFAEILDKIIVDIYLKENVFIKDQSLLKLSQEEKIAFVEKKRREILDRIRDKNFLQEEYLDSKDTSFKMTSCVKCSCLGIFEKEYDDWKKENPHGVYCDVCNHKQDDFLHI